MFHVRKSNQSVIRSADFHNAKVCIDFYNRIRNSADDIGREADRSPRTRCIGARLSFHGTYGKGYSLNGTDRVAAIARIAGAAQYLMTIHGIAYRMRRTHTLDHRPAPRSVTPSAAVSNLCPDMPTSTSGRRTVRPRLGLCRSPERRASRAFRLTRHDNRAAATRPSLNRRPHERHRRVSPLPGSCADG